MATRYIETTPANAAAQAAALSNAYQARERAARGLRAQDSLDVRIVRNIDTGEVISTTVLPLAQAVTTSYCTPIVSDDGLIAAVPVDDADLATLDGRHGVNLTGHRAESALDSRIRQAIERERTAQSDGSVRPGGPIGLPRSR